MYSCTPAGLTKYYVALRPQAVDRGGFSEEAPAIWVDQTPHLPLTEHDRTPSLSLALFAPFLGIPSADTDDFYIDRRVSRRRIHRCKNRSSPPRESRGKEGNRSDVGNLFPLLSSGFPWRRRTIFTSMDPSSRDASIDVKIVRLRQGNPEEWGKESQRDLLVLTSILRL